MWARYSSSLLKTKVMKLILYFTLEFNSLHQLQEKERKKNETKRDETVKNEKRRQNCNNRKKKSQKKRMKKKLVLFFLDQTLLPLLIWSRFLIRYQVCFSLAHGTDGNLRMQDAQEFLVCV
jgi:uncharacterized ion transporter superfamily protein YfcC